MADKGRSGCGERAQNLLGREAGPVPGGHTQVPEPNMWGSAFAVYLGVANRGQSLRIARYFKDHYQEIVQHGQLRHLPGGVYWEAACPRDTYQNGGFWATPVGWFVYTLDLVDPQLASQTLLDLVEDFQKRGVTEWVREDHQAVRNYIASATMPLAGAEPCSIGVRVTPRACTRLNRKSSYRSLLP